MELRGCIALLLFGILGAEMKLTEAQEGLGSDVISELDAIRKDISSATENLKVYVNERLKEFENIQSNLTRKLRSLENSVRQIKRNCANSSSVSTLNEDLQNLDKFTKAELQSINSDLLPRVKQLEEKCSMNEDVIDAKLRNHRIDITALLQNLMGVPNTCDYPPRIENGYPISGIRGTVVKYACRNNLILVDKGPVECRFGEWVGVPPLCIDGHFDATFTLQNNFDWPKNIICYSDENYENIQFSRAFDTGQGLEMPRSVNYTKNPVEKYARVQIPDSGAYQCKSDTKDGSMRIVTLRGRSLKELRGMYDAYELAALNPYTVATVGDNVEFNIASVGTLRILPFRWKHNGADFRAWDNQLSVRIPNVKLSDAGIYECFHDGRWRSSHAVMRLIVRKCKENFYGKDCEQNCPPCYNGGVCHEKWGMCICPAGFTGTNCEVACGEGRFGVDCTKICERDGKEDCANQLFCKPDPFGCACAPGYVGDVCQFICRDGWYGADCKQPCHCAKGPQSCNIYTGSCDGGCSAGWTGDSCQIQDIN